ncbi:AraC family transcriptional regulator [Krasilnikovia sp. M28-CT-15]|uniref:AraC family transcriptional regulator n=1 Tax=Krasilnikovia sp. M28-CT-15 TaxID=3373540 RepID=UPI0038773A59
MDPVGTGAGPVHRFAVSTDDPQEAVEIVRSIYADTRIRISGDEATFSYRHHTVQAGSLAVDTVRQPMSVDIECPPFDSLCVIALRGGQSSFRVGTEQTQVGPGDVAANPVGVPFSGSVRDVDTMILRMPVAPVAARAGLDPDRFRLTSVVPFSPALGRHFRSTMDYVHRSLQAEDTALMHPLVLAGVIDLMASAVLATFPHACDHEGRPWIGAAAVRRAVAFIEANLAQPMTIGDIAAAAGVSVRALQQGFREQLGVSPVGYLRRVRLAHAHDELRAADPARTGVSRVAHRWGFGHLGRFAGYYRAVYGCPPSETLHR